MDFEQSAYVELFPDLCLFRSYRHLSGLTRPLIAYSRNPLMPDLSHIVADRLVNIAITGPLVGIERGAMRLLKTEGNLPQLASIETLVMPLDGFVALFGMMESMIKRLIAYGVLKQNHRPIDGVGNASGSVARK